MSEEHEGISENRVTFYRIQGHNHDGENSTLIDFSKYDLSDIIDLSQFNAAVLGTIENNVIIVFKRLFITQYSLKHAVTTSKQIHF